MKIKNKHLRKLHIYASLISCTLLLFFSITGITLNHRSLFEAEPKQDISEHPLNVINENNINAYLKNKNIKLSKQDISSLITNKELSVPSPGQRLELYIENSSLFIEASSFGITSRLNELHQSRYTSDIWIIISDLTAVIFIFIAITGIWLSLRDNKQRRNYIYFLSSSLIIFILFME